MPSPDQLAQLYRQVELLEDAYSKLPRTPSFRDLAAPLAGAAQSLFPSAGVTVSLRTERGWEGTAPAILPGKGLGTFRAPGAVAIVQSASKNADIGLALTGEYAEGEIVSVKLLLNLCAHAYGEILSRRTEKDLLFSLNHRVLQLNSLIDTGIELSSLESREAPHRLALARAASVVNASRGAVRVLSGTRVLEEHGFPEGNAPPPAGSPGISTTFEFASKTYQFELYQKESRSGPVPFEETDQLLLDALARQVHASLENRYLLKQSLERERIEQELNVAATIQQKIIPVSLPPIPGYEVAGKNIPSKSVGGDYYDCIRLATGKFCLVVADVSGKGVPAALLVSSLHAYLSAYLEASMPVSTLAGKLNSALYRASTSDRFVTAFLGLLTPESGEIECVNAGHNPTYVLRKDGTVEELKRGGLPLGVVDMGIPYESESVTLARGEKILLYSDGVTEAENEEHNLFEQFHTLPDFMTANAPLQADAFIARLIADVKAFTKTAPQNDDITALYLSRLP